MQLGQTGLLGLDGGGDGGGVAGSLQRIMCGQRLFHFGEMGMLNLMVFEAVQAGSLTLRRCDFQVIFPDHAKDQLRRRFRFDGQGQPVGGLRIIGWHGD